MRRSEINRLIRNAEQLFLQHRIALPPFAAWTENDWTQNAHTCDELFACNLGWDITDFGHGDFQHKGLLLFTLRNGCSNHPNYTKPYAEKIMISTEGQLTLMHCHQRKTEDIINRAGGRLTFELYNRLNERDLDDTPVTLQKDGQTVTVPAGGRLTLMPGQSLTLTPNIFHQFWAEKVFGDVIIGEVSSVNDDHNDNLFHQPQRRFPEIIEDAEPYRLLVSDYAKRVPHR
jgi:D-lyxose ketol-isomerase